MTAFTTKRPFHIMTKPIGPVCNLACEYCFYCEKKSLFPEHEAYRMDDAVLETFVRKYIESQETPEINFAWQGGEPTLMGLDFFRRVVDLQDRYADGKRITNSLQTNAILIDDEWAGFLAERNFLVGVSIDGPPALTDRYRKDRQGVGASERILKAVEKLKAHRVEYNSLTSVARANSQQPLEVYRFLKQQGFTFMQFIPIIERLPDEEARSLGLDLAAPPTGEDRERYPVTDWTVRPDDYGKFLIAIFDEWVRNDIGSVYVQQFDVALGNWVGQPGGVCVFAETCGNAMVLEHNGDVYACDHYVYPRYRLGNIVEDDLPTMAYSDQQMTFGNDKRDCLPQVCRDCDVLFACHGECPKHRFMRTPDGEPGLSYLCGAYKAFFHHIEPYMYTMGELLKNKQSPAQLMEMIRERERQAQWSTVSRNDPCPCGSGRKYKKCCGRGG